MSVMQLSRPEIAEMKPYSSARSEAEDTGVLLNANELPWPLIDEGGWSDNGGGSLNRYPMPQPEKLVSLVSQYLDVPTEQLLLTRGSDDGIDLLVRVFCRAGTDSVLDCPPSFGMYRIAAQIQGAGVKEIIRRPDSLSLDHEGILFAVAQLNPPKIIFLTSPGNPTGDVVDEVFLGELLEETAGKSIVVVDEAYIEFSDTSGFAQWVARYENLVVLRTLSKAFGSAALRCGVVVAQPVVIDLLKRVIPPYPLATPVVALAQKLFTPEIRELQNSFFDQIRKNKQHLVAFLDRLAFIEKIWPGHANFVLARVNDAERLVEHCASQSVIIRMFSGQPELENCVRITVGSQAELECLMNAITSFDFTDSQQVAGG